MPAVVLEETQHIVGDYRARWRRRPSADANRLGRRTPFTCSDDDSIRVAKDCRPSMRRLVVRESSVLLFKPVRHALVIVVEERDERSIRLRQQRVSRLGNPAV
jgi:hypothetical protein